MYGFLGFIMFLAYFLVFLATTKVFPCKFNSFLPFYKKKLEKRIIFPVSQTCDFSLAWLNSGTLHPKNNIFDG